jgi:hypothetical protein
MRDTFLGETRFSQLGLSVRCSKLAAFFCTLSNARICPSCTDPSMQLNIQESAVQVT